MAERKAKPAAKKAATTKAVGATAGKSRTLKAGSAAKPGKAAVAKPKITKIAAVKKPALAAAKSRSATAPAAKKAIVPAAAKKAPAQKAVASAKPAAGKIVAQPTSEERYRMVQTAAYFIAERNGFGGCPTEHWAAAELEIASRFDA